MATKTTSKKPRQTKAVAAKKKVSSRKPSTKVVTSKKRSTSKAKVAVKSSGKNIKPVAKKVVSSKKPVQKPATKPVQARKRLWQAIIFLLIVGALWLIKDQVIVATVNGRAITRIRLIRELEQQGGSQVLDSLITQTLVEQQLDEAGIKADEDQVVAQMQEIEDLITAQGQSLDDLLAAQGLTKQDVENDVRLNLRVDQLLADRLVVSDEDVQAYFDNNRELLGEDADFDTMKEQIRAQVESEKKAEVQQDWLNEIHNQANIKYFRFAP